MEVPVSLDTESHELAPLVPEFRLVRLLSGRLVVNASRSINRWAEIAPRSPQVPGLKNPRCGNVSRRNTEAGLFDRAVAALKTQENQGLSRLAAASLNGRPKGYADGVFRAVFADGGIAITGESRVRDFL